MSINIRQLKLIGTLPEHGPPQKGVWLRELSEDEDEFVWTKGTGILDVLADRDGNTYKLGYNEGSRDLYGFEKPPKLATSRIVAFPSEAGRRTIRLVNVPGLKEPMDISIEAVEGQVNVRTGVALDNVVLPLILDLFKGGLDLIDTIGSFEAQCNESEYTDTDICWQVLHDLRAYFCRLDSRVDPVTGGLKEDV